MTTERTRINTDGGSYFAAPPPLEFISSGCTLLNCVLGGGYAEGRVINIVGDKSTGKTLLAIEACANFARKYEKAPIRYNEVEAAFDIGYAQTLGLPTNRVEFVEGCFTVEEVFVDLEKQIEKQKKSKQPMLYILDSLDALSDKAELERDLDEGTYGAGKAKQLSQMFRRLIQQLESSNVTIIIISQVRDNIGVTFGKTTTRSGGRALDFYASQVLWLSQKGAIKVTRGGVERAVGVNVKAKCEKNKVSLPFRECEFPLVFGYGVEDLTANLSWLLSIKQTERISMTPEQVEKYIRDINKLPREEYDSTQQVVIAAVTECWYEIEKRFLPTRSKYASE